MINDKQKTIQGDDQTEIKIVVWRKWTREEKRNKIEVVDTDKVLSGRQETREKGPHSGKVRDWE